MIDLPEIDGNWHSSGGLIVPPEVELSIREFWPDTEWQNAANVGALESAFDPFAVRDTRRSGYPCGSVLATSDGLTVTAELSIGIFQINACNLPPDWEWQRLYNVRHNCGTAHMLWNISGWLPWYFSAKALGLLPK